MVELGRVQTTIEDSIGVISFFHPKGNSLPGEILRALADRVDEFGAESRVRAILLKSEGDRTFCAGASFEEFLAISNLEESKRFFRGFADLIAAMRRCPKFIVVRVQGKVVGGGVGLVAAADYALATAEASVRLSELSLGIGPFIIGPAVERKIGLSAFAEAAIDAEWKDAAWALERGLYSTVCSTIGELDERVAAFCKKLAGYNPAAMKALKEVLWRGTEEWGALLEARLGITAKLVLSDFVKKKVSEIRKQQ